MSLNTWCHQGPCDPSSCNTFILNPHWGRVATGHKRLVSMHAGSLRSCPTLCNPVVCGLPGLAVSEVLQARILECIDQYCSPYSSRALYFWLPQPPTPLSTWCCQNPCDPSSCTTSTPGPHRGNPRPPGQPQEQSPVDDPHVEVEIKTQLKPRGSVTKEEDPKLSHQLYKLQLTSTQSTRQTL